VAENRAFDVANYVVHYALTSGHSISHLKLQKILYFLEANYLVQSERPLIIEEIEKWKLGPVIPKVYHEYKIFGSRDITRVPTLVELTINEHGGFKFNQIQFNPQNLNIDPNDIPFIEQITDAYIDIDSFELVDATHRHPLWAAFEDEILAGGRGLIYDKNDMRNFFIENPHFLEV
jgi:uncharacterized phage-associated protein